MKQQVSPALIAVIVVVLVVVLGAIAWKVFAKPQAVDNISPEARSAYESRMKTGGGPPPEEAAHQPAGGNTAPR